MSKHDAIKKTASQVRDLRENENASAATRTRTVPKIIRDGEATVRIDESDAEQLQRLYGTKTSLAAGLILTSALNALGQKGDQYFELMTAMAAEMEPRDAIEAMLITQMSATHVAITNMSLKFQHADSAEIREAYERSMTRLSRTFLAQMDQLKKYRAKAQQIVRVERVEVKEGGQAIVGDVSYKGGGNGKKDR